MEAFSDGVFSIAATLLVLDIALRPPRTALEQAQHEHLYAQHQSDDEVQTERRELWPVVPAYVAAILIGLAAPTAAVVLYLALAVFLVVPFRDVGRLLRRTWPTGSEATLDAVRIGPR